jgi:hypothetical protein
MADLGSVADILKSLLGLLKIKTSFEQFRDKDNLERQKNYDPSQYDLYVSLAIQAIVTLDLDQLILYAELVTQATGEAA